MNKKVLAILAGTMLVSSVAVASPVTDLQEGQTDIGYDHYNLNHSVKDDNFYIEHALSPKFTLGVEQNSYSIDSHSVQKTTDIALGYNLDKNVRLTVGSRNFDNDYSNKVAYGIAAKVDIAPKMDLYAGVTATSVSTDWQTGLAYNMDGQTSLHFGYKSYKQDDSSTVDGVGFGINYKF